MGRRLARGDTVLIHWNGKTWSRVPSPTPGVRGSTGLWQVAAISRQDAWAVGSYCAKPYTVNCTANRPCSSTGPARGGPRRASSGVGGVSAEAFAHVRDAHAQDVSAETGGPVRSLGLRRIDPEQLDAGGAQHVLAVEHRVRAREEARPRPRRSAGRRPGTGNVVTYRSAPRSETPSRAAAATMAASAWMAVLRSARTPRLKLSRGSPST